MEGFHRICTRNDSKRNVVCGGGIYIIELVASKACTGTEQTARDHGLKEKGW